MLKAILTVTLIVFPWPLRRRMLNALFGYQIDSTARIGFSLVCPEKLIMEPFSRIGHFNCIRSLDEVIMEEGSIISGFNWASVNLREEVVAPRRAPTPRLVLRRYAGITARHYLDCSDEIEIGEFALVAGMRSLLMTHRLNIHEGHQTCAPIKIGAYCFVSTSCTLLGGAELPHHSVLAAGSVLIENPGTGYRLYAGVPAAEKRGLHRRTRLVQAFGGRCAENTSSGNGMTIKTLSRIWTSDRVPRLLFARRLNRRLSEAWLVCE